MSEEIKHKEKSFCVFSIGEREFLLPKESVINILDIKRVFTIPGAPDYILGALPFMGKIVPAIDLAKVYNIEGIDYSNGKLIVIEVKGERIGILSEITPFFVDFDAEMILEDLIDPEKFFEQLKVNSQSHSEKKNDR
ncbi:MAG: chemotaxis protein CheW [Thermodesulfovibrio sp.]|nr:chemotaxis protein CheW [Thermodesulfovibrio sp.]MDW7998682.1 chemotaxis protein CheW [Thermodesulfovibrio sp.]